MKEQLTIKEVEQLRKDELNSALRDSKKFSGFDKRSINILHHISAYLSVLTYNKGDKRKEVLDCIRKIFPRNMLSIIEGNNSNEPYMVNANFGEPISGVIFEADKFFNGIEHKPKIVPNMCFDNCLNVLKFCVQNGIFNCAIVSGIDSNLSNQKNQNVLHSVVVINGIVLDFNSNMAISDSLYFSFFDFEPLSIINVGNLIENSDIVFDDNVEKESMYMNFAFDDYINWLRDKQRQKREPLSIDMKEIEYYLNYLSKKNKLGE